MAESDAIQEIVNQAATAAVMTLRGADAGLTSGTSRRHADKEITDQP